MRGGVCSIRWRRRGVNRPLRWVEWSSSARSYYFIATYSADEYCYLLRVGDAAADVDVDDQQRARLGPLAYWPGRCATLGANPIKLVDLSLLFLYD